MNTNISHVLCETHALSKSYRQFEELKPSLNKFIENSRKHTIDALYSIECN
jgi:hypothetical protein